MDDIVVKFGLIIQGVCAVPGKVEIIYKMS